MAKARRLEDSLAALRQLRDPTSDASIAELRRALGDKSSHVVTKAAQIAAEHEIAPLTADLAAAFDRFLINAVKTDPGCHAKAHIAEALQRIGTDDPSTFLRGIHCVQLEPVWGGKADTAGAVRSACALGLVRIGYADALTELADLLVDPEPSVRATAARAIAHSENEHGVPVLRLKVLVGDAEVSVISECLTALLQLAPDSSVSFIAGLLDAADVALREVAALALGGSRLPAAFAVLKQWWERVSDAELRRTALLAIAMTKREEPIAFLLSLVAEANGWTARDAIAALGVHRYDEVLAQRVRTVAASRDDVDLREAITEAFGEESGGG